MGGIYLFTCFEEGGTRESEVRMPGRGHGPMRLVDMGLCSVPSLVLLIGAVSKVVWRNRDGWVLLLIDDCVRLMLISFAMCIVYRAKSVSANILTFQEKRKLVKDRAFWLGVSLFFPSVLYVGAELTGCLIRAWMVDPSLEFEAIDEKCGALFPGAKAVTLHLTVLYFITTAFAPLEGREINMIKVMTLKLSKFQFLQLSLFFFSCVMALVLYGTRNDGPTKNWQVRNIEKREAKRRCAAHTCF